MGLKTYCKRLFTFIFNGIPVNHVTANIITLTANHLLEGRCALITGGTSGIGFAIARAFLQAGATVIITGRTQLTLQEKLEELLEDGKFAGRVYICKMNNIEINTFESCWENIVHSLPGKKIDILVNNAGIESTSMPYVTEEDFDKVIDTNLKGTFFLSQFVGKYMVDNKIQGNILNISSSSCLRPANSPYILSKWGIRALTMGLAKSLSTYDITVNSIAPGPTMTPMLKLKEKSDISLESSPIKRYVMPEEVAQMAVLLVSDMGRTIVGDTIFMTGGLGNLTVDDYDKRYSFD
ncbi:SDR family oxidoreductase [uncultured Bacteroides sp.]|uniref:SDR family NAD(P)-dependent oxidoreductase n=1 Tax=uncultured Bacteroides sp. TaxID=162156 RepID=UPI0025E00C9D|nr:SDR family oxidoreductase [uncultured Bacteroides sp.]